MEKAERAEAKAAGALIYFTGRPCKHGHITTRQTSNGCCTECHRGHQDKINKRLSLERAKRRPPPLPEEEKRRRRRVSNAKYIKSHPAKHCAKQNRRRAVKLRAMPDWCSKEEIDAIYLYCQRISEITGVPHQVDHYYPLQGDTVSGLHVGRNLQVIPATENQSKSNKHPEDIEYDSAQENRTREGGNFRG